MPKMSQIHEELRVPDGHKHTYIPEQLYIERRLAEVPGVARVILRRGAIPPTTVSTIAQQALHAQHEAGLASGWDPFCFYF